MIDVGVQRALQRGDRHRRFTLAVDLHEALAHHAQRLADVGEIHRAAAIDDGAQPLAGFAAALGGLDQALDHGRRGEHRDVAELLAETEHLVRIEPAGLRHDMPRTEPDVDHVVEPGAVRDRRGVQRRILGRHRVDIGQIAQRHRHEIAVAEHHALGPAGGAGSVEQPGEIVIVARDRRLGPLAAAGAVVTVAVDRQHRHAGRQIAGGFVEGVGGVVADQRQPRFRVAADPGDLLAVQLGVDRDRHRARPPDAVQRFEIARAIMREQRDAIAGRDAVIARQRRAERGRTRRERRVVGIDRGARQQRRSVRP